MKRRSYRLGRRQATAQQTRSRIIAAARELLAVPDSFSGFTIDSVGARAGVTRMTIYNQFGSKRRLLEALFDDLAARGLVERLRPAFACPDPQEALMRFIAAFAGFWSSDRIVIRRIRSLASIDPDFEQGVRERDERRRGGLRTIVGWLDKPHKKRPSRGDDRVIDVLHTLTSFETYDNLAGTTRSADEVVTLLHWLARAALELGRE